MVEPTLKDAAPGDLTLVLPYRYIKNILEMLEALNSFMPGVWARHTLLYGVEVKYYSARVKVDKDMCSEIEGLLCHWRRSRNNTEPCPASVSGVIAARGIASRE